VPRSLKSLFTCRQFYTILAPVAADILRVLAQSFPDEDSEVRFALPGGNC
jgi:hypothetical protein